MVPTCPGAPPPHHSPSHAASCGRPLRPTVHEEAVTLVGGAGHGEPVEGAFVVFFVVIKADSKKVRGENIRISCNCQTLSKGSPHAFPRPFNGSPLVGHLGRSVTTLPGGDLWITTLLEQPEEGSVEEGASGVSTPGYHVTC